MASAMTDDDPTEPDEPRSEDDSAAVASGEEIEISKCAFTVGWFRTSPALQVFAECITGISGFLLLASQLPGVRHCSAADPGQAGPTPHCMKEGERELEPPCGRGSRFGGANGSGGFWTSPKLWHPLRASACNVFFCRRW